MKGWDFMLEAFYSDEELLDVIDADFEVIEEDTPRLEETNAVHSEVENIGH